MRAFIARLRAYFAAELAIQRLEHLDDRLLADMDIPREAIRQRVRAAAEVHTAPPPQSARSSRQGANLRLRTGLG